MRRALEPLAQPGSPGAGGFSRRPRPAAAWADRADALHGARLPLRQQRVRVVHAPPQRLDAQRPPRPGGLGGGQPGHHRGRARRVRAAVLHAVVRERQAPVLQVPRDPVAPAGPPRGGGLRRALPAAWAGPHRLPRAGPAAQAGAAVRGPVPPRPADDHRSATGGELGDQAGQRRRGGLAARSSPGAVAGADRGQVRRLVSGVRPARPRRRRDTARGHRLGGRVPARGLAAAHPGRADPQHRQGPRRPQPPAVRPHHPALATRTDQALGPAATVAAGSPWPPCSTTWRP